MKNVKPLSVFCLILSAFMITGCKNNPKTTSPSDSAPVAENPVQRGEYLVTIMGCNDCHSPKQMGPQGPVVIAGTMLSGYPAGRPLAKINMEPVKSGWVLLNEDFTAAAGQWGISFAANLTSDQTGIGNWTEDNFKRALKEGKYKGLESSRLLLPPMPWTNFISIKDEDVKAIFLYLMSTRPVKNVVPLPETPDKVI